MLPPQKKAQSKESASADFTAGTKVLPADGAHLSGWVAIDLLAQRLPPPGARCRVVFAGIGSAASCRNAVDADGMLAEGFGRDR